MTRVIVFGGGVGGEREVSLDGARAVADALRSHPDLEIAHHEVHRLKTADIQALGEGVIFPVLHGPWGEGGPLQVLLEELGRVFVGSQSTGASIAMDKVRTLEHAERLGIAIPGHQAHESLPETAPIEFPLVVKPISDGSSVGVRICRASGEWTKAIEELALDPNAQGPWLIERFITGREMTVSLLDGRALPIIEIVPSSGFYDYNAKYQRDDTQYLLNPPLPRAVSESLTSAAEAVFKDLELRHLARADFVLDANGVPRLLEINTMPGFTSHSLVPKAAQAIGLEFPDLCRRLVDLALQDAKEPMVSG